MDPALNGKNTKVFEATDGKAFLMPTYLGPLYMATKRDISSIFCQSKESRQGKVL
jgi:hypothetical protein